MIPFIDILFGHLFGDFIFQNKYLAVKKSASNLVALTHVTIYTFFLCLFTVFNWKWALYVFICHLIIDRFSLADKWLQLIRGRDLPDFFYRGHNDIPISAPNPKYTGNVVMKITTSEERLNYRILRGSFSSIVYTVVDATMHLASMYYAYPYFFNT